MSIRPVSVIFALPLAHLGVLAAGLILPAPARSAIEKVVGGDRVHQGETRRITLIGDGLDSATSVVSSDARIGVRLLSKEGLGQGRAKGQIVLEVAVPLNVPKNEDFNLTVNIAPNQHYAKGGSETLRLNVQDYPNSLWRPLFHFAPTWGWMNDPNGLVYVNGTYHLYYQAVPFSQKFKASQINWGHAVSTDLVRWSQRRDTMFSPSMVLQPSSDTPDQVWSPFSGSAVVVAGQVATQPPCNCSNLCVASIFTKNTLTSHQDQWLAASCNGGESFKAPENVLPNLTPPKRDFRDPKVFPYQGRWIMVLAVGSKVELYESNNLRQWNLLSSIPLYSSPTPNGPYFVVETPDLIELPVSHAKTNQTKWVLLYSELTRCKKECGRVRNLSSRSLYMIGEFDGRRFKPESQPRLLDFGPDFYAPQTWANTGERRILAGWQNNWRYASKAPTTPWRGQLSIPRNLGLLHDNGTYWLTQTPVPELATLRSTVGVIRLQDKLLTNRTPEELRNFRSTVFDADLAIDVASVPMNAQIKLHLRSSNSEPGMVLTWRRTGADTGVLSLTRSAAEAGGSTSELKQSEAEFIGQWSSIPFALAPVAPETGTNHRLLKLRVLVDRSSVEVFAGDGQVVFSSLFFPNSSHRAFKLYATGGTAKIVNLVIYPFKDN